MTKELIKVGCIGCGWIVANAHIPALMQLEDVQVAGVFDADLGRAQDLAERYGIAGAYDDMESFLRSGIHAVIVATPNCTHVQYAMQAIEHGLHVLCEKPITVAAADAAALIQAAQTKGVVFFPGYVNRYRKDIMRVSELLTAGEIGEVTRLEAGWLRRSGVPRPGTWFTHKAYSGGGVLIDLGSHIIDLCLMMMGGKSPQALELTTTKLSNQAGSFDAEWFKGNYTPEFAPDVEDTAFAKIAFEDNALLEVKLSWKAPVNGDCTYFDLHGTKGVLRLHTLFGFSTDRLWNQDTLVLIRSGGKEQVMELDRDDISTRNAFTLMARAFIDAVKGLPLDKVAGRDGWKTVDCIERLYAAEHAGDEEIWKEGIEVSSRG